MTSAHSAPPIAPPNFYFPTDDPLAPTAGNRESATGEAPRRDEPLDVRLDALSRLRETAQSPSDRLVAASAGLAALAPGSDSRVRLRAATVLGEFVDLEGVLGALGTVAATERQPTELRYNAYTSLQVDIPTSVLVSALNLAGCTAGALAMKPRTMVTRFSGQGAITRHIGTPVSA